MNKKNLTIVLVLSVFITLFSCGGDDFKKNPVDELILKMDKEPVFTIILQDMDVEGSFFKTYKHKYKVITEKDSVPKENITDWTEVDENFFSSHVNDLGMELASKKDGKITKDVGPAGFSNYVGNPQYGHWVNGSGGSFWEFYGKYAMFSSLLNMATMPYYRSHWDDYSGHYRGHGRGYYGSSTSAPTYGTYGTSSGRTSSTWFSKSSNQKFADKVRNRVSRSSSSSSISRSSSRFSSGSSSRSRGGGFGK